MKAFFKTLTGKILLITLSVLLTAFLGLCGYTGWYASQPKFQEVTVELGEEMPAVDAFLTQYAKKEKVTLTDNTYQLSAAGVYPVEFSYNGKVSSVNLTVEDTVAPTLKLKNITVDPEADLKPEDLVAEVSDLADVTLSFSSPYEKPTQQGERTLEVTATDASGNQTTESCTVLYVWILDEITVELGNPVTKELFLLNPERDGDLIKQKDLDKINKSGVGTYTVTSTGETKETCTITVVDTTAPALKLKNVSVMVGEKAKKSNFIKSCTDASSKVTTTIKGLPDFKTKGDFTITIEAVDPSGNKTTATAKLSVTGDRKGPVFSGLKAMDVKKGSSPNWKSGVKAKDNVDGYVDFTVNTDKVNMNKAGTYYATYTAVDAAGNKTTARRKVVVGHSDADTKDLIKTTAAKLSSDALTIGKWVRKNVRYNTNWGGNDPIWYGLKKKVGNCYVHAKILDALLKEKGYQTKLIWVTDKSHYWNIVKIDGKWWHIDSTPGSKHPSRLMDDEDRYKNLQGRNWDRSQWPECK